MHLETWHGRAARLEDQESLIDHLVKTVDQ